MNRPVSMLCLLALAPIIPAAANAQGVAPPASQASESNPPQTREAEIRALRQELDTISARLAKLEHEPATESGNPEAGEGAAALASAAAALKPPAAAPVSTPSPNADTAQAPDLLHGTTLNFGVDGYYSYNFNSPVGRVNLLRPYDVSSNSFSLNQVSIIAEHLPTPQERVGGRIDLMFGPATEFLQGSAVNEQRPQAWRNLYQAYGSYLAPVGSGLQVDFGKWASSLGDEGNYTKDQIAYSRSFSFTYLPSYHMGLRANYNLTPRVNVAYWLVNGINDTEDLNGSKSQAFAFTLQPAHTVSWTLNYYFGREARDVEPTNATTQPAGATQPGLPTTDIKPAPNGRDHIFDTYATWNVTPKLMLVGEADFVVNRTYAEQQPGRVADGSVEGRYTLPRDWTLGGRAEYFDDRGGLLSGKTQALKEVTAVVDHTFGRGFIARAEYRHDFSNQRFFLSDTPDVLKYSQTTATLGLIYWWGTKQGSW